VTFPDVPDPYWVGIDPAYNPGDSIAWLGRLEQALRARQWRIQVFDDYYRGKHRLAFASPKFRQAFGGLFNEFADDWCQLVVDAVDERLAVQGFRLGTDSDKGDADAWRIWQSNNLDAESRMGHVEALVREECSAIVWADPDNDKIPTITIEDPSQVIVAFQPGSRKKRLAALKMWTDEDGRDNATVYLPDAVYKYQAKNRNPLATTRIGQFLEANREAPSGGAGVGRMPVSLLPIAVASPADTWEPRETAGEPWPLPNPMGVVPVVPIVNRPRLIGPGESEIRKVIPLQDAINKQVADMMVASEFTAFRQRYVTGMDIPVDAQGNQVEPFVMSADRLFIAENPAAKFGEFSETNLGAYVASIEMLVQHIASQTRTPPHYFYLSGHFPSGESIKSAETGLVAKCRSKQLYFGEAWEEVIRLAFRVLGDKRADVVDTETIWRDCESRSEGEHIDASLKKLAAGVPQRQIWEDMGYTQAQIDRFKAMRAEEAAEQAALSIGLGPVLGAAGVPNPTAPGGVSAGTAALAPAGGDVGGADTSRPHEAINVPGSPLPLEVTSDRVSL
jgi:hypothetical protein